MDSETVHQGEEVTIMDTRPLGDMEKFKAEYPTVYEKFLEMNRALAKIQRRLMQEEPQHRESKSSLFPEPTEEYNPNFLELD